MMGCLHRGVNSALSDASSDLLKYFVSDAKHAKSVGLTLQVRHVKDAAVETGDGCRSERLLPPGLCRVFGACGNVRPIDVARLAEAMLVSNFPLFTFFASMMVFVPLARLLAHVHFCPDR